MHLARVFVLHLPLHKIQLLQVQFNTFLTNQLTLYSIARTLPGFLGCRIQTFWNKVTIPIIISRYVKHQVKVKNTSSSLNTSPEKRLEILQLWWSLITTRSATQSVCLSQLSHLQLLSPHFDLMYSPMSSVQTLLCKFFNFLCFHSDFLAYQCI